jgi:hypothetical protein
MQTLVGVTSSEIIGCVSIIRHMIPSQITLLNQIATLLDQSNCHITTRRGV